MIKLWDNYDMHERIRLVEMMINSLRTNLTSVRTKFFAELARRMGRKS